MARHCERSEAIQRVVRTYGSRFGGEASRPDGLLRFARNDGPTWQLPSGQKRAPKRLKSNAPDLSWGACLADVAPLPMADALSTAAFLVGREAAPALLARLGAQAPFVDKSGGVSWTPGFAVLQG